MFPTRFRAASTLSRAAILLVIAALVSGCPPRDDDTADGQADGEADAGEVVGVDTTPCTMHTDCPKPEEPCQMGLCAAEAGCVVVLLPEPHVVVVLEFLPVARVLGLHVTILFLFREIGP